MSTLSAVTLSSTLSGVVGDLNLRTGSTNRLTVNSAGVLSISGNYTTTAISAASYNGYTPLNKSGDTSTGTFNTNSNSVFYQVSGNNVYHTGNYSSVINRGNPGSASPLLLDRFDQVHVYSADNVSTIQLSTTMVADSVYVVHYTTTGSNANADPVILPNYTAYAGQFSGFYYGSPQDSAGNPQIFNQPTNSGFYFDHYGGGLGNNPCGTFILFNFIQRKHAIYHGGDTSSHAFGTTRWNNSSTVWTNIGTLEGMTGMNVRVHVRRIG